MKRYYVELLDNGLIRVFDRASKLSGLFYQDDYSYYAGDIREFPDESERVA